MNPVDRPRELAARLLAAALPILAACGPSGRAAAEDVRLLPDPIGVAETGGGDIRSGLGLSGYDPASYLLDPAPRAGRHDLELVQGGTVWRFAGEANRAAFLRDPAAFLPRLDGYDPVRAAAGLAVRGDPAIHAIQAGRLYLFRSQADRAAFAADPALAGKAEAAWDAIRDRLVRG